MIPEVASVPSSRGCLEQWRAWKAYGISSISSDLSFFLVLVFSPRVPDRTLMTALGQLEDPSSGSLNPEDSLSPQEKDPTRFLLLSSVLL